MLIIQNVSGVTIDINDLGLTLANTESVDLSIEGSPQDVTTSGSTGGDLNALIASGNIVVKDPLDGVTNLSTSDGILAASSHNDTHFRMPVGGRIADATDVDLTAAGTFLRYTGTNFVRRTPLQVAQEIEGNIDITATSGYTANGAIDWTADQGATDINVANLPIIAHSTLSGLTTGDPHTQYVKKAGDTMTGSLLFSGSAGATINGSGSFKTSNGSSLLPSYSFTGDTDTGIYYAASNTIAISAGGTARAVFGTLASTLTTDLSFSSYPSSRDDGATSKALYVDATGALKYGTVTTPASLTVQDEGTPLATSATTLNFVGDGVVASGTGATKTITISGGTGAATKVMNTWTSLSGNLYYNDFTHNLGTDRVTIHLRDTVTNQEVRGEYTEIINANTVRLVVNGNSENITMNVVSGTGATGAAGPAGAGMISGVSKNSGANVNAGPRSVLNFIEGTGITLTVADDAGGDEVDITVAATASAITVQDEGTPLTTSASTLNFVGAGVTATGTGAIKTVTVPGSQLTVPSTDLSGNGSTISAQVDVNAVGFGAALYMAADGNFETADADFSTTMPVRAMALETGTGVKSILLQGFIRNDAWNWIPGACMYVSTTTGLITQTQPTGSGDQVQKIGFAWNADVLYFNPGDYTIVEVA